MPKRNKQEKTDRRSSRRFQIEEEMRYKVLARTGPAEAGSGKVLNISSTGVSFVAEKALPPGERVEMSMNWPARVNHVCPMKLVIFGWVVRSDATSTVLSIERYEFRTRGATPMPLPQNAGMALPA